MVNLLVLLLLTYHLRAMIESFLAHNFVLKDKVMEFLQSGIITDPRNYYTLLAGLTLIQFPAFGFVVEKLAAMGYLNNCMVIIIEVAYLTCLLIYPIVLIQWIESDVLPATYFMLFATTLALKLTSFHHVCLDNRYLLKRVKEAKKSDQAVEDLASFYNINENTFAIAMKYPNNLDVGHYIRFLIAPTCCY